MEFSVSGSSKRKALWGQHSSTVQGTAGGGFRIKGERGSLLQPQEAGCSLGEVDAAKGSQVSSFTPGRHTEASCWDTGLPFRVVPSAVSAIFRSLRRVRGDTQYLAKVAYFDTPLGSDPPSKPSRRPPSKPVPVNLGCQASFHVSAIDAAHLARS